MMQFGGCKTPQRRSCEHYLIRISIRIGLYIFLLTFCLLVGWNYWIPTYLYSYGGYYGLGGYDFSIFYAAGSSWLTHEHPYLNSPGSGFVYPPTSLPFFGLFALFNLDLAKQLWAFTYFIVFAVALLALALTIEGEGRLSYISTAVLLFFTSISLMIMMGYGQSHLLVASLAVLSFASLRMKHPSVSAALLSIASLVKGPPILLLIYFVLYRKDLQYFLRFVFSTVMIIGASLLVVPIGLYWYYVANVAPALSIVASGDQNLSIVRYISLAGMSKFSPLVSLMGICLFAAFSVYVGSHQPRSFVRQRVHGDGIFLMNILVMLLLGPRTWPANYVWVILPVALVLSDLLIADVKAVYLGLFGFATFLLNSTTAMQPFLQPSTLNTMNTMLLPLPMIGTIVLILILIPVYFRPTIITA